MKIFLSYNRINQAFVKKIYYQLSTLGYVDTFEIFFDDENLSAGDNWAIEIDSALSKSDLCIIFVGADGIGSWQSKEALKAVNRCVDSNGKYKIIPLILPHQQANLAKNFPWFLADYEWVQFTDVDDPYAFSKLVKGIRNEKLIGDHTSEINPYKGLDYFDIEDATFFFGRTFDLNWVFYKKLRPDLKNRIVNFIAIVGDSGSGKSSFARAGILASIQGGKYENSENWLSIVTKPGDRPLLNLSTSLKKKEIIEDSFCFDKKALESKDHLRRIIEVNGSRVILFIDQFEEVLIQCKDEPERKAYLQNIAEASKSSKLITIVTLRSDYYSSFSKYSEFSDILESNNYTLSNLDFSMESIEWEKRIIDIIEMPAKLSGVIILPSLTTSIIQDLKGLHGTLPLLQMTLSHLWKQRRHQEKIDSIDYATLSGGKGIAGIIETHAEKVYTAYTNEDKDIRKADLVKNVFIRLVELSAGKSDVRKNVKKEYLAQDLEGKFHNEEITDVLLFLSGADARLISINYDEDKCVWIQVVHEVLIRKWMRLKNWVNERREALIYKDNLLRDIEDYRLNKTRDFLYFGLRLKKLKNWAKTNPDLVSRNIVLFIGDIKRFNRRYTLKTSLLFIIVLVTLWVGYDQYNDYQFYHSELTVDFESRNIDIDSVHSVIITNQADIKNLNRFKNLDSLILSGPGIVNISSIKFPKSITYIELRNLENIYSFFGFEYLPKLVSLKLSGLKNLTSVKGIEKLHNLTAVTISDFQKLNPFDGLNGLHNLTFLALKSNNYLETLSGIELLKNLKELRLSNLFGLRDIRQIEYLKGLNSLLFWTQGLDPDLSCLDSLNQLNYLNLSNVRTPDLVDKNKDLFAN